MNEPTTLSADWVLAVVRSRQAAAGTHGYRRVSWVDGPFAETKEWMGGGMMPVRGPCESCR